MPLTQAQRTVAIDTPLGKDVLVLRAFQGEEGISRLFSFQLELLSEKDDIDFAGIVGKNVTVSLKTLNGSRFFNGIIRSFAQAGNDRRFTLYRAEMVPWIWLLTQRRDCRIFQNLTVPDIIQEVLARAGFNDVKNALQHSYAPREYCVQYRESDFDFISRLMEEYGIFYFFEHDSGKHTLVLGDSSSVHEPCPGQESIRYQASLGDVVLEEEVVTSWLFEQQIATGKYSLVDYNFETPSHSLLVGVESIYPPPEDVVLETYDTPGGYLMRDGGEDLAKIRIEQEESSRQTVQAESNSRCLRSGYRFELTDHYRDDLNAGYLLTSVRHQAEEGGYETGSSAEFSYTNKFTAIPLEVPFRPRRLTPRPLIAGTQSAVVVGKKGEEIWVDKHGRVKVQFHWDREGRRDENSSCWIRVSQSYAGKGWGWMSIPRIGQEVLIDFLEGDPDRPVITGRLYNGEQTPPYALPSSQAVSGLKSNSTKGGGGYNEISFDDTKGKEKINIHGQYDMSTAVLHDQSASVGNNQTLSVAVDRTSSVGSNETHSVGSNRNVTVGQNESISVGTSRTTHVQSDDTLTVGQNMSANATVNMSLQAGVKLELSGPGGSITIDASGVTIQGVLVKIN